MVASESLFHQELLDNVPLGEDEAWNEVVFNYIQLEGLDGQAFFEHVFDHVNDMGKSKNKRIYIGPGRDGSSDDKISIDCKFDSLNTKVSYSRVWAQKGFVKTSYANVTDIARGTHWEMIEDEVDLDSNVKSKQNELLY